MLQDGRPIAYASRALTSSETRYAQIEKELLAILFAATKFHHYIYGSEVAVESDHKPLEAIVKKPLHSASPRIQMMLLKLMKYNLAVKYVPGSKLYIADTLSRAYISDNSKETKDSQLEEGQYRIHSVTESFPATPERMQELRDATGCDPDLQKLRSLVHNGWPLHRSSTPPEIHGYWQIRDEIHEENGLLFAGERLLVPVSMRCEMLSRLHQGHAGVEKCKLKAATVMFWPNMNRDIDLKVAECPICVTYSRSNQREPMIPHELPSRPWAKLGSDIFEFAGKDYLVVVDYFSKYPEVISLPSKTATSVIAALKSVFARHGIPDVLVSDNMPFASAMFRQFASDWGFQVITSSPTYPQSNGQSERFVQTVKNIMRKSREEGRDIHLALLEYRNTPLSGLSASPAQLLMSRRLKDRLPSTSRLLRPAIVSGACEGLNRRQKRQKHYFDKGTRPLKLHNLGDSVRVRLGKTWEHAQISGNHETPRSYIVTTEDGRTYRRNKRVLKWSPDKACVVPDSLPLTMGRQTPPFRSDEYPTGASETFESPKTTQPPDIAETITEGVPKGSPSPACRRSQRMTQAPKWHKDYKM